MVSFMGFTCALQALVWHILILSAALYISTIDVFVLVPYFMHNFYGPDDQTNSFKAPKEAWSRRPTGFLQCFDTVGLVIWPIKIIRKMTYNVLSENLSLNTTTTTLCLEKVPILKLSVLCQTLTDLKNFCTTGKRMQFATKPMRRYPSHLMHVATLPGETRNSNLQQMWKKMQSNCTLVASNFVIRCTMHVHAQLGFYKIFTDLRTSVSKQCYFSFDIHFSFSFYKFFYQSFLFLYYISIRLNKYFSFYKFFRLSFSFLYYHQYKNFTV